MEQSKEVLALLKYKELVIKGVDLLIKSKANDVIDLDGFIKRNSELQEYIDELIISNENEARERRRESIWKHYKDMPLKAFHNLSEYEQSVLISKLKTSVICENCTYEPNKFGIKTKVKECDICRMNY